MLLSSLVVILSLISGLLMLFRIPLARPEAGNSHKPLSENRSPKSTGYTVSVIIPARNEARRLPPLLASMKDQDFQPHEFIVVDDQSIDQTADIARAAGATVIVAEPLVDNWIGKSRACWTGARAATGDWLLFLDADTRFVSPSSLSQIMATFHASGAHGSMSFQPYHTVIRLYESLSAVFNIILMAGMSVFTPWGERLKGAGLFGPCLICRREDYFAVGGHEAIKSSVMDDLALGQSFHKAILPVHCFGGKGLISFRMYPEGISQLFEGWTKNFGSAAPSTHPLVFSMIIVWICGGFSLISLFLQAIRDATSGYLLFAMLAYVAYAGLMVWLARRTGGFHILLLIFFPILLIFFAATFFWSLYLTKVRRTVSWRGRKIKI